MNCLTGKRSFGSRTIMTIVLLSVAIMLCGQVNNLVFSSQRSFACVVIDAQTSEPLENATLRLGQYGCSADGNGRIETFANVGDTLVFTHVGYFPVALEVKESFFVQSIVAVKLSPDTVFLSEVVVKPRNLLLREARQMIEEMRVNEEIAKVAFANSKYDALSRPSTKAMDALDNQNFMLNSHISRTENNGLITGASISLTRSLDRIVSRLKRNHKRVYKSYKGLDIKPLSAEELSSLIREE